MNNSVSVVIPVYNAAAFVTEAVESALAQPETTEIILIEDASPDHSLEVCQDLAEKYPNVRLYQHPGGTNLGAGASRNLGIEKSSAPLIAFLDADDFYLPGRFTKTREILEADPTCDGVYEAIGIHFENETVKQRWLSSNMSGVQMTTVTEKVSPEDLFRILVKGWSGHIHLNGLVIRRAVLDKTGMMDVTIADTLHEDTDFILRLAAVGRLMPGRLDEPVAKRRVHAENRISISRSPERVYRERMKMWKATYAWCRKHAEKEKRKLLFKRIMSDYEAEMQRKKSKPKFPTTFRHRWQLFVWLLEFPGAILEAAYWQELVPAFLWNSFRKR